MKKIFYIILWLVIQLNVSFADWGMLWIDESKIRNWDIHTDDIPKIMSSAINFFLSFAWSIAIIFVIVWAYKILFWPVTSGNSSEWKNTIIYALTWFAIASLSWFIIKLIIDNFS